MKKIQGAYTQVKVISRKGDSVLVEWIADGGLNRKRVPAGKVTEAGVSDEVLAMGIPYGFPWDEIAIEFDRKKFSVELHNLGIWTAEDALKSPQKISSALRAALADNLSKILDLAKLEKKGVHNG